MDIKNQIYIVPGIIFAVSLILSAFLAWPVFNDIRQGSEDITAGKNKLFSLEVQNSEFKKFQSNYSDYSPLDERINSLFLNVDDPINFIKFLESSALGFGLNPEISLVSVPGEKKSKQNYAIFQISVKGDFNKILKFSNKIETGSYLVEIQNLNIRKDLAAQNTAQASVQADFSIRAYLK